VAKVDYFLKIDGIDGESIHAKHKGEIDVEAWSWGVTGGRPVTGGGAGKVAMNDFSFTMKLNKASPQLFLTCAEGKHIKSAWLTARRASPKAGEYFLKWTFSDVLVSSYQTGGAGEQSPLDEFAFNFAKIEVEYKFQKADGSLGAGFSAGWDLKENKKV
jgi:type VI secretion system secreted protein Hcp